MIKSIPRKILHPIIHLLLAFVAFFVYYSFLIAVNEYFSSTYYPSLSTMYHCFLLAINCTLHTVKWIGLIILILQIKNVNAIKTMLLVAGFYYFVVIVIGLHTLMYSIYATRLSFYSNHVYTNIHRISNHPKLLAELEKIADYLIKTVDDSALQTNLIYDKKDGFLSSDYFDYLISLELWGVSINKERKIVTFSYARFDRKWFWIRYSKDGWEFIENKSEDHYSNNSKSRMRKINDYWMFSES